MSRQLHEKYATMFLLLPKRSTEKTCSSVWDGLTTVTFQYFTLKFIWRNPKIVTWNPALFIYLFIYFWYKTRLPRWLIRLKGLATKPLWSSAETSFTPLSFHHHTWPYTGKPGSEHLCPLSHLTDLMSISEMFLSLGWKDWGGGLLHGV